MLEIPVAVGVVAFIAAPVVTAVGALAALAAQWSAEVERDRQDGEILQLTPEQE
ncbi:hypothetical protein GCM10010156_77980 [Planobispora rosea]|uniref:DUF4342 domain-containing protein n=1 Tax=Planobispora rosea TaxID=35762 RepID=A0A8J3WIY0_PLARO|nr:hypothetical protein GCM10010156_77980 [Planobispora rosea]GIH89311.1 hypothetical protein Pro02_77190 [Planobispora rosea]